MRPPFILSQITTIPTTTLPPLLHLDQNQHLLSTLLSSSTTSPPTTFATTTLTAAAAAVSTTSVDPNLLTLQSILDPTLNILSLFMLARIVISWYPNTDLSEPPFSIVAWPTEPLLKSIRGVIPPAFGVDITPIVWLGVFTFLHEILVGEQGLITLKIKYGI